MRVSGLFKFKKISWKFTFVYAVIFSLILIILNASVLYGVRYYLVSQAIKQVEEVSKITFQKIVGTPTEQVELSDAELVNEYSSNSGINIKISMANGNIANSLNHFSTNNLNMKEQLNRVIELEEGEMYLVVKNMEIIEVGKVKAYLQVARNMENEYSFIRLLFLLMVFADLIGIIASIVAGFIIVKKILKPIDEITKAARSISISDLNSRIETGEGEDELVMLAITFNEMLERLKESFEKQNQFVSDASHELRTPVSVIQGYIELIDEWGKDNRAVLNESVLAIKSETLNMAELIEKLLFLARGDSKTIKPILEKFYLNELAEEVVKESKLIFVKHNIYYDMKCPIQINGDKAMLKQMLRALVDNSIKYTPENGTIAIIGEVLQSQIKLVVKDTGIGIPQNDIGKIFDRFFRIDKSRESETGGSGLGLSIVKWIVDEHNGKLEVDSEEGVGTSVAVWLPL